MKAAGNTNKKAKLLQLLEHATAISVFNSGFQTNQAAACLFWKLVRKQPNGIHTLIAFFVIIFIVDLISVG